MLNGRKNIKIYDKNKNEYKNNNDSINNKKTCNAIISVPISIKPKIKTDITNIKSIIIMSMNIDGLRNKIVDLRTIIIEKNPSIIAIQETNHNINVPFLNVRDLIPGYSLINHADRRDGKGGVATFAKNDIKNSITDINFVNDNWSNKLAWTQITMIKVSDVFIMNIYRSPNCVKYGENNELLASELQLIHEKIVTKNANFSKSIIVGDLNLHVDWHEKSGIQSATKNEQVIIDTLIELDYRQNIFDVTREGSNYALDVCLSTSNELIENAEILKDILKISDHWPIIITLKTNTEKNLTKPTYNYKKMCFKTFNNYIKTKLDIFSEKNYHMNLDEVYEEFHNMIEVGVRISTPKEVFTSFKDIQEKQHKEITRLVRSKRRISKEGIENVTRRTQIQRNIDNIRVNIKKEYKDMRQKLLKLPNGLFKRMADINAKNNHYNAIYRCEEKKEITIDTQERVNIMSKHFAGNQGQKTYKREDLDWNNVNEESLHKVEISISDIEEAIRGLKNSNVTGHNGLNNNILKSSSETMSIILFDLLRRILNEKRIPNKMKIVRICPIKKPGKNFLIHNNNRPINIENSDLKLFETLLLKPMKEYLDTKNFWHKHQFGFIKKRCRVQNLLLKSHYIAKNLEYNEQCTVMYFDIRAAFDSTNNSLLCEFIYNANIRGQYGEFVEDWLNNAYQYVQIGDFKSMLEEIRSGCKQGSVFASFLYGVYNEELLKFTDTIIDEICVEIENTHGKELAKTYKLLTIILGYADDTSGVLQPMEIFQNFNQKLLDRMCGKGTQIDLEFHPKKTEAIYIGKKHQNIHLHFGEEKKIITPSDTVRDLGFNQRSAFGPYTKFTYTGPSGVMIDRYNKMKYIVINTIVQNKNCKLSGFEKAQVWKSFVLPFLTAECIVWAPSFEKDSSEKMAKFDALYVKYFATTKLNEKEFKKLPLLPSELVFVFNMIYMHRIIHRKIHLKPEQLFDENPNKRSTRSQCNISDYSGNEVLEDIYQPYLKSRTQDLFKEQFGYRVIKFWYKIPLEVRKDTEANYKQYVINTLVRSIFPENEIIYKELQNGEAYDRQLRATKHRISNRKQNNSSGSKTQKKTYDDVRGIEDEDVILIDEDFQNSTINAQTTDNTEDTTENEILSLFQD